MGHGVTAETIEIGFVMGDATSDAAVKSVGGSDDSEGPDEERMIKAIISYLDAHGGIAGRKIVPIIYAQHTSGQPTRSGREQDDQQACSLWTEDNQVAIMGISGRSVTKNLVECAAEADTPFVFGPPKQIPLPESLFSEFGRIWYAPNWMNSERYYNQTLCNGLSGQAFFEGAKVAIMAYDDPWVRESVNDMLKPCLNSRGVNVVSEVHYPDYLQSPWTNYVLQFQGAGVTHILWAYVGLSGLPVVQFMHAAESQQYRPLYGGTSDMHVTALRNTWQAPSAQLRNLRGVGVNPFLDVDQQTPTSASGKLCQEILIKAGFEADVGLGNAYCQGLFFVKTVFDRASALTTSGFEASVANLGNVFDDPVAINGASFFGPTKHDGAALVRDFAFSIDKDQFVYTSPPRALK